MFKIIISSGWITHDWLSGLTESEAIEICQDNNWEWYDENQFCWSMDYVEDIQ